MRTAPPTVPGMLTPNSSPVSPQAGVFAAAEGSRAPPPQTTRFPSRSIRVRSPASFSTSPRNPSSETSRFEPEPTTPIASPSASAQASSSTISAAEVGLAKKSAGPPIRMVVSFASG